VHVCLDKTNKAHRPSNLLLSSRLSSVRSCLSCHICFIFSCKYT